MEPATRGIGEWLRERCQKEGLSLRQVAAKSGLCHTTIAQVINGSATPSPETIKKLAQAFGGNGRRRLALEDKLLVLAGYRTSRPRREELSEPMARLLDKLDRLNEPQLKLMGRFADFLAEMEAQQ